VENVTMTARAANLRSTRTRIAFALLSGVLIGASLPALAGLGAASPLAGPPVAAAPPPSLAAVPLHGAPLTEENESTLVLFNNTRVPGDYFSVSSSLPSLEAYNPTDDQVYVEGFYAGVIDVLNASTNEVARTISTGAYPNTLAYDPENNNVYFGLQTYDEVSVANASTDLIQRTVGIGFEPLSMAADPVSGNVFVTGTNSTGTAYVAVINGSTGVVITTFPFGAGRFPIAGPNGLAYDPANGYFYVASIVSGAPGGTRGNLTVLNASSFALVKNISLTFNPSSILYAPSNGDLYLGNESGNNLRVFNPVTAKVVHTVALPNLPTMLAYGAAHKRVYVGIDGNVSVVSTASEKVVTTFPVTRQPDGLAVDSKSGNLYISDYVWNNVSVVNTTTFDVVGSILLGALPYNMAYDSANGDLYVADLESSQLIVVNGSSNRVIRHVPLGTTPYGIVYDPLTKDIYVDDYYAGNVSIVSGATNSVIGYLPAGVEPWGIAYDGANHDLYVTNPGSDNITVLNPHKRTVVHNLNFTTAPGAIAYDPESQAIFVGEYDIGNVSVLNATTNQLIVNATTGSEPYTVSVDPITGDAFVGNFASDNVSVLGPKGQELGVSAAAGVGVFGSAYDPVDGNVYVASFDSDLITTINATTGAGVGGFEVGSGPVAVAVNPVNGTVYVANYDSGSLTLLSREFLYNVTFSESGLPSGKYWSFGFDGRLELTTATSITFTVANGSYSYFVAGPSSYQVSGFAPGGTLVVNGANLAEALQFVHGTTYNLTFKETGLPNGTVWCVTLGAGVCSGAASIVFHNLTNGTYPYRLHRVTGFKAVPGSGTGLIAGADTKVLVKFKTSAGILEGATWQGPVLR
jgi:YVTN family beta-propeller protein